MANMQLEVLGPEWCKEVICPGMTGGAGGKLLATRDRRLVPHEQG